MRFSRTSIVLFAAVAASLAACGSSAGSSGPPAVPPASAYRIPAMVRAAPPGTVFRALRLQSPSPVRLWMVLYHSRSRTGRDVIDSGVVAMPSRRPPPGGFPIVVFGHGMTGFADAQATSRTGDTGTPVPIGGVLHDLLGAGYAAALPDYEGLGTPGPLQLDIGASDAHAMLDAARAARALGHGRLSSRVAVVGHSEGGHAALWAGQLARAYAPELDVRAVVASAPGANLVAIGRLRTYSPQVTTNVLGLLGDWHEVYGVSLDSVLTPAGIRDAQAILVGRTVSLTAPPFRRGFLADDALNRLVRENTPGASRTAAPILMLVGTADRQVPPAANLELARSLRRAGDQVTLRVLRGADHDHTFLDGRTRILAFLRRSLSPTSNQGRHK